MQESCWRDHVPSNWQSIKISFFASLDGPWNVWLGESEGEGGGCGDQYTVFWQ